MKEEVVEATFHKSLGMEEAGDGAEEEAQEFPIFVRRRPNEACSVMNFHCTEDVVFAEWREARMRREDNSHSQERASGRSATGSEEGRRQPAQAAHPEPSYRPEDQPWLLRVDGKRRRTFRGRREGGITDHSAYYVFSMKADGTIEASPVGEWHTFEPLHTYKTLSIEEAEQLYKNRDKKLDYFAVMIQKRLNDAKSEAAEEDDGSCETGGTGAFDVGEGHERCGNSGGSSGDEEDGVRKKSSRDQSRAKMNRLYSGESDDELIGEMDDDDDSSDSSEDEDEAERPDVKGKESEKAEDEKEGEKPNREEDKVATELEEGEIPEKRRKSDDGDGADHGGEAASKASEDEPRSGRGGDKEKDKDGGRHKRKIGAGGDWRAPRASLPPELAALEEAARRHLKRRPVTVQQLLRRLKPHRRGLPTERVVEAMARVLRNINPRRRLVHGKMYLFVD